ncbi:hypothetical protein GYMLUDRAFT_48294 [Collybiopsis luxurians FD-317 M1]|uniref:DUF6533 domain-containing protein n=1 Tax=Collybiopsis luxurians FD-317 M1 TaxID=944289 RepID=A0A0D0CIV3_9AGAR|nr:hypothetical protein GYMLUDRAFT_48294 [Collybiopsis luxurians FD-317 M1]
MRAVIVSQWNPEDAQVQMNWERYVWAIQFVILIYDWLLTLDREIELFWKRDCKRLPAILFFVNRYLSLLGAVPTSVIYFMSKPILISNPQLGGRHLDFYLDVFLVLIQLNLSALFILRVTAIYGGSKRILIFLSALGTGVIVNGAVQLSIADRMPLTEIKPPSVADEVGNVPIFSFAQGLHLIYLWAGVFVFDLTVFSLTVWKTASTWRNKYTQRGIVTIIMRDGLMYFGIITLTTLANVLVLALGSDLLRPLLTVLTDILSCILMSHMMFNLREDNTNFLELSTFTHLSFARSPREGTAMEVFSHTQVEYSGNDSHGVN